jgi:acylphosphatase
MNKCLKITLWLDPKNNFLHEAVQKSARQLELEGLIQQLGLDQFKIIVCGKKDNVDLFVDFLHNQSTKEIKSIEIEPFLKDRDYRGVFRVIE